MRILIASYNPWKVNLFASIFRDYGFEITSLVDEVPDQKPPNEDASTVIGNALIKARYYYSANYPWVFADDSGLEIEALNREPGVQTRRWGGKFPNFVDDQVWLDYLLDRMRSVPPGMRTAYFVDGWALIAPDGTEYTREIRVKFEIAEQPVRPLIPGSPIMAVTVGLPTDPVEILAQARIRWQEWGILDHLFSEE